MPNTFLIINMIIHVDDRNEHFDRCKVVLHIYHGLNFVENLSVRNCSSVSDVQSIFFVGRYFQPKHVGFHDSIRFCRIRIVLFQQTVVCVFVKERYTVMCSAPSQHNQPTQASPTWPRTYCDENKTNHLCWHQSSPPQLHNSFFSKPLHFSPSNSNL